MRITDLLNKQSISLNLKATNKMSAIDELVDLVNASGNLNNKEEYISKLSSLDKLRLLSKEEECNIYKNIYLDTNNKTLNTDYKINRYMLNTDYKVETTDN